MTAHSPSVRRGTTSRSSGLRAAPTPTTSSVAETAPSGRALRRTDGSPRRLRPLFLILAFVSIGLEFRIALLLAAARRPVGVFAGATAVNLLIGLLPATLLFSGFAA